jgi:uncharacterized membrane protein
MKFTSAFFLGLVAATVVSAKDKDKKHHFKHEFVLPLLFLLTLFSLLPPFFLSIAPRLHQELGSLQDKTAPNVA